MRGQWADFVLQMFSVGLHSAVNFGHMNAPSSAYILQYTIVWTMFLPTAANVTFPGYLSNHCRPLELVSPALCISSPSLSDGIAQHSS